MCEEMVEGRPPETCENKISRWQAPPLSPAGRMWALIAVVAPVSCLTQHLQSFLTFLGLVFGMIALEDLDVWALYLSASAHSLCLRVSVTSDP